MNKQRVYRSGLMVGSDGGPAAEVTVLADARCPHPTGRAFVLFATPTLPGVIRWVLGHRWNGATERVHEITVDADTTWVYLVRAWERTREDAPETVDAYWATGMTLTDWLTTPDLDGSEWEVLVGPSSALSSRPVSAARVLAAAEDYRLPEITRIVRDWRRGERHASRRTCVAA